MHARQKLNDWHAFQISAGIWNRHGIVVACLVAVDTLVLARAGGSEEIQVIGIHFGFAYHINEDLDVFVGDLLWESVGL